MTWQAIILAVIAATPPTIVAWAVYLKARAVLVKASHIETLANGSFAKMQAELKALNEKNVMLQVLIERLAGGRVHVLTPTDDPPR